MKQTRNKLNYDIDHCELNKIGFWSTYCSNFFRNLRGQPASTTPPCLFVSAGTSRCTRSVAPWWTDDKCSFEALKRHLLCWIVSLLKSIQIKTLNPPLIRFLLKTQPLYFPSSTLNRFFRFNSFPLLLPFLFIFLTFHFLLYLMIIFLPQTTIITTIICVVAINNNIFTLLLFSL